VLPPGFRHPLDSLLPERLALLSEVLEDTQSVAEHAVSGVGGVEDIVSMLIVSLVQVLYNCNFFPVEIKYIV